MSARPSSDLVGRRAECERLVELLDALRQGQSGVQVIRGEAGIGKSALLDYLTAQAGHLTVCRTRGIEADMELAYAGLHHICAPFLDSVDALPEPQRNAIQVAFGTAVGDAPDRFLVGLAVLSLLTHGSEDRPILVVVDDAQWLDQVSRQTLEFVARRLLAEPIAIVFAVRDPEGRGLLAGLPTLSLGGLESGAAGELLESAVNGHLEERVRQRLVAETHGNPLALLELYRGRSAAELAYGLAQPTGHPTDPVANRVERDFMLRLDELPTDTRTLLLIAAADPVGDPGLLGRAAATLHITPDSAPATSAGLVSFDEFVRFRHPLVRSAVYFGADPQQRRAVHRALAESTDEVLDPDRRAWHFAQAAEGPDESVALGLDRAAGRARQRGGMAAEAVLLERAAELTPDVEVRGRRALAAAEAHFSAASAEQATRLATLASVCPLQPLDRARLDRLRARILFARSRSDEAAPLLLDAAGQFAAVRSPLARETYLEAISATVFAGRVHGNSGAGAVAIAARASGAPPSTSPAADLLLDGVSALLADGLEAGLPALQRAFQPFADEELGSREATLRWLLLAPVALESFIHHCWDLPAWDALAARAVRLARDTGALSVLSPALVYAGGAHLHHGDFDAAAAALDEAEAIATATGNAPHTYGALVLAAWRGDEVAATNMIADAHVSAAQRGEVSLLGVTGFVESVLYNGHARYEHAMQAAQSGIEHDGFNFTGLSLVEHIEAATRCGELDQARSSLARLVELTEPADSGWARGVAARSRALLADGDQAEALFRTAIKELERDRVVVELARTHLLFGEWLRRNRERRPARDQLRTAYRMFDRMGAAAFAERARRELVATGEHVQSRAAGPSTTLTPQEAQIAGLAANGMTNPMIGAELFLSPHTVEWHLRKVYSKLGISSRRELTGALAASKSR